MLKRVAMHENRKDEQWDYWYVATDSPAERKLLLKLGLQILPYTFIMFWIYYIDSAHISRCRHLFSNRNSAHMGRR